MGKTLLYLLILAILGISVYFFIIKGVDSDPYSKSDAGFTIKDTAQVGKLFIANNFNEAITAERTDSGWIVNGKYRAFPGMVNIVLGTLTKQHVLYPVAKAALDNAVKVMSTEGIKVEVYDRKGNKMSVFYVGGAAVNGAGTNMLMEGSKIPYVVQETGFTGILTPRYNCELKSWRDRTVFDLNPDQIQNIAVKYYDDPKQSFVMTRDNHGFTVTTSPELKVKKDSLNTNRVNYYLSYFSKVSCEGYLNGATDLDSAINENQRHAAIEVTNLKGRTTHAEIFWMLINKRSKNHLVHSQGVPDNYDSDRMFAVVNGGADTLLIQTLTFNKILRKGIEFYQHDSPQNNGDQLPRIKKVPLNR